MMHARRRPSLALRVSTWCCLGAVAIVSGESACRAPTQVTIEIVGEVPYREGMSVAVQLAEPGAAESAPARVVTKSAWKLGESIGTVVVGPGERASREVDVRIALGIDRDPLTCTATDARGCLIYRRRVSFVEGEPISVRAVLRSTCVGIYCDAETSCRADKTCGPLDSEDAPGAPSGTSVPVETTSLDPYAKLVVADRPRHYYRFDEPPGSTVAKDTMGRADGVYSSTVRLGATGALTSSQGTAAYFDGVSASMDVPGVDDFPGAMTLEAWVRSDSPSDTAPVLVERIDKTPTASLFGYRLSTPAEIGVAFDLFRGGTPIRDREKSPLSDGFNTTYVVAIAQGGKTKVYVNARLLREETFVDQPPPPLVSPLRVGGASAGHFRGTIDELALYDYPLPPEVIAAHYAADRVPVNP